MRRKRSSLSRKKAKIFIKSDSWSLWISSILCREERDIYTRTDKYILSGGERVDDGDDEREEEEDRSERFFVGRDRE